MTLYFDTSALVKLFSDEQGSKLVRRLISNPSNAIWVLELALIEMICTVYRKHRNNEIHEDSLETILTAIEQQFRSFRVIPLASDVFAESKELMKQFGSKFGLRTLDALHIAGFSLFAEPEWTFVSSDKNQLHVVEQLDYQIVSV
jgi:predicted nucleic acid-binding protein